MNPWLRFAIALAVGVLVTIAVVGRRPEGARFPVALSLAATVSATIATLIVLVLAEVALSP